MTWRHTRNRNFEAVISKEETDQLFEEIQNFTKHFLEDVVLYDNVWADMSEPAGNTPRERSTDSLCISVTFFKEPEPLETFYITENNQRFHNTALFRLISTVCKNQNYNERGQTNSGKATGDKLSVYSRTNSIGKQPVYCGGLVLATTSLATARSSARTSSLISPSLPMVTDTERHAPI